MMQCDQGRYPRRRVCWIMVVSLAHVAAAITVSWGVAHAVPTSQVIAGFEPITVDNRRVMLQEWLVEAVTMWGIAALVIVVTAVGGDSDVTAWVYRHRRCACRRAPACPRRTGPPTVEEHLGPDRMHSVVLAVDGTKNKARSPGKPLIRSCQVLDVRRSADTRISGCPQDDPSCRSGSVRAISAGRGWGTAGRSRRPAV